MRTITLWHRCIILPNLIIKKLPFIEANSKVQIWTHEMTYSFINSWAKTKQLSWNFEHSYG